jgi:hypothetical protein
MRLTLRGLVGCYYLHSWLIGIVAYILQPYALRCMMPHESITHVSTNSPKGAYSGNEEQISNPATGPSYTSVPLAANSTVFCLDSSFTTLRIFLQISNLLFSI